MDYCQLCFARRTSDPHDKTRSWLPIILTFLGLITPQEVAETVARYGGTSSYLGVGDQMLTLRNADIFYKQWRGNVTRADAKIQAIKMEMLQRAAPVKMLICSPLHSCEI